MSDSHPYRDHLEKLDKEDLIDIILLLDKERNSLADKLVHPIDNLKTFLEKKDMWTV